jgi:hypothetical protein
MMMTNSSVEAEVQVFCPFMRVRLPFLKSKSLNIELCIRDNSLLSQKHQQRHIEKNRRQGRVWSLLGCITYYMIPNHFRVCLCLPACCVCVFACVPRYPAPGSYSRAVSTPHHRGARISISAISKACLIGFFTILAFL